MHDGARAGSVPRLRVPGAAKHFWECIVSEEDGRHFIRVLNVGLGTPTDLASEEIEQGIERFAATLPDSYRLGALVNVNPCRSRRSPGG